MKEIVLIAVGALLPAIGSLLMRWLRKDRITEEIARKTKMLELRERMQSQGVTFDQLHELEASLMERQKAKRDIEDALIGELQEADADDPTGNMSQAEMNQYAEARAREMDAKLDGLLVKLQTYMGDDEQSRLEAAQKAWLAYRDAQVELSSANFDGGTMQPLVQFGEQLSLTIERIATVQGELEFREAEAELLSSPR
jgi:uncharacterized protein YecT (DUF1311 family)